MIPALSWLDWTLLAVLVLSVVVGLVRGFVFECLSLAGWVAAWFAAQWGGPVLALYLPQLSIGSAGSALNQGLGSALAFALVFVAALIAWSLLARLIRMLIQATPLSLPDRLLGAGFGLLRGTVLLLVLATVVTLTPASQSQGWRTSHGAHWLGVALVALKPLLHLLPASAARLSRP